ncbi:leucine-rich repeat-containing protein 74B-like isoform X2 [Rhopilema esculentum]|uniref:leucine-rich repeat-containing protein 74B-like isoform X2 n=1 Tax=Rhopilema esculentum TaxID=499914 RepID=UPI0031D0B0DD
MSTSHQHQQVQGSYTNFAEAPTSFIAKESASCETELDIEDAKLDFDATGKRNYLSACEKIGTTPVSHLIENLAQPVVHLRYHGIGSSGAIALSRALGINTMIVELDLYENYVGQSGAKAIAAMLKENCYIANMNLGRNYLTPDGCKWICEMLQTNTSLLKVDLSCNEFGDKVGDNLANAIKSNCKLAWLNLSENDLGEKVGIALGPAITMNDALEHLDLSWNQIRGKGAADVAAGLWTNCTLKYLDLSWNGFGNLGALALAEALRANNTLTELDISNNRIGTDGALLLAKGISGNNTLEILKMDGNPIRSTGVVLIVSAVNNKSDTAIRELHFKGIVVDEEFEELHKEVTDTKKIVVFAEFSRVSALQKIQRLIDADKDKWILAFEELDEHHILRVPNEVFFNVVETLGLHLNTEEKLVLSSKLKSDSFGNIYYRHVLLGFSKETPSKEQSQESSEN